MKTKRLASLALAGAMALTMSVPAFAADDTATNTQTVFTSTYSAPTIKVVVPTTGTAVINPLGLGMTVKDSNDAEFTITGQIVSAPAAIENQSNLRLSVGASVTGTVTPVEGAASTALMKFSTTTTKGVGTDPDAEGYVAPATSKSAFVQLQVVSGGATFNGKDTDTVGDEIVKQSATVANWTSAKSVTVGTKEAKGEDLAILEAATVDASDGSFTSYKGGSVALYRLYGDCVEAPKNGWTEDDGFTVNVAFTFKPAPAAASSGS